MPDPEAELQATANLSPVSPSPVHTASPLVVPALQDTVDTIDAMVAAAVASTSQTGENTAPDGAVDSLNAGDMVDDDPYGDDAQQESVAVAEPSQAEPSNNDDDYAKTFDSPIGSDDEAEGQGQDAASNSYPLTNLPSVDAHSVLDPLLAQASVIAHAAAQSIESAAPVHNPTDSSQEEDPTAESGIDLQRLVADLTAQSAKPSSTPDSTVQASQTGLDTSSTTSAGLPPSSSLPPRPPIPNAAAQSHASQHHPGGSNLSGVSSTAATTIPGQPLQMAAPGAPGTSGPINSLPPPPASGLAATGTPSLNTPGSTNDRKGDSQRHPWEQFLAEERQYMAEAKWDRFPEGSRIFIGNLSSDKVSKRDVFDVFHSFGRLAQISLKSAYGFVQYHTADEGLRAIEAMEGAEIKGRRIHLEVSKLQDKSKKERARSPDKGHGGRNGGRRNEKGQQRDEFRPRNNSPRRHDGRGGDRDRDRDRGRGYYENGRDRNRSRSPGYGRNSRDYRRRSPSPYSRDRRDNELDLPRRYGADVPDVQIILQPEVHRDFTAWVEGAFKSKGLRTEVMFLHPRMPKDQVIQRQAVEGVHAVVDLDARAQHMGKIPVQAFDRSNGASNVRFDQYVDLDPPIAAEVILRTKASSAPVYGAQSYQPPSAAPPSYGQPYGGHVQPPANVYGGMPTYPQQPPAQSQIPDLSGLAGKLDSRTLNQLLSSLQGGAAASVPGPSGPAAGAHPPTAPQPDIQAILNTLSHTSNAAPQQAPAPPQYAPYGHQAPAPYQAPPTGDSAAQVQNIMAQLARFRQ